MVEEKNIDISVVQAEIEQLKGQIKNGSRAKKRLTELENSLLVGMVEIEDAYKQLLDIKTECGNDEAKAKQYVSHIKDGVANFFNQKSKIQVGSTAKRINKSSINPLPSLINKSESLLLEIIFDGDISNQKKLLAFLVAEIHFELVEAQKMYSNNERLQEILLDEIGEYDDRLEGLKKAKNDNELSIELGAKFIKSIVNSVIYKQLIDIKRTRSNEDFIKELLREIKKSYGHNEISLPLIMKLLLENID